MKKLIFKDSPFKKYEIQLVNPTTVSYGCWGDSSSRSRYLINLSVTRNNKVVIFKNIIIILLDEVHFKLTNVSNGNLDNLFERLATRINKDIIEYDFNKPINLEKLNKDSTAIKEFNPLDQMEVFTLNEVELLFELSENNNSKLLLGDYLSNTGYSTYSITLKETDDLNFVKNFLYFFEKDIKEKNPLGGDFINCFKRFSNLIKNNSNPSLNLNTNIQHLIEFKNVIDELMSNKTEKNEVNLILKDLSDTLNNKATSGKDLMILQSKSLTLGLDMELLDKKYTIKELVNFLKDKPFESEEKASYFLDLIIKTINGKYNISERTELETLLPRIESGGRVRGLSYYPSDEYKLTEDLFNKYTSYPNLLISLIYGTNLFIFPQLFDVYVKHPELEFEIDEIVKNSKFTMWGRGMEKRWYNGTSSGNFKSMKQFPNYWQFKIDNSDIKTEQDLATLDQAMFEGKGTITSFGSNLIGKKGGKTEESYKLLDLIISYVLKKEDILKGIRESNKSNLEQLLNKDSSVNITYPNANANKSWNPSKAELSNTIEIDSLLLSPFMNHEYAQTILINFKQTAFAMGINPILFNKTLISLFSAFSKYKTSFVPYCKGVDTQSLYLDAIFSNVGDDFTEEQFEMIRPSNIFSTIFQCEIDWFKQTSKGKVLLNLKASDELIQEFLIKKYNKK